MLLLENKVAMVTGAGRGIGKASAKELAREGARLVLAELDESSLDQTASDIREMGGEAIAIKTDVTDRKQIEALVSAGVAQYGHIDILLNNVGGSWGEIALDIDEDTWHDIVDLNLTSQYLCCQAVVPHMQARKDGRIVNISSNAGRYMSRYFSTLPYCAAKAGVSGLTRQMAYRFAPEGIRVNAIEPGHVWTELTQETWPDFPEELRETIVDEIPLGRMAEPAEIAYAVVFLASDESSYMTGATIEVNGGLWMS